MGEIVAYPRQVTPVVVQHTTTVDQGQVVSSKFSVSASPMRSSRDGYGRCVGAV